MPPAGWLVVPWNQFFVLQELDAQIDHLREELALALRLADPKSAHLEVEIVRARRLAESLQSQLHAREQQRDEAAALIPAPFVARYNRLRTRVKTRPWVVSLHGSACPACNIVLPSKLAGDAERTGDPVACPSCARLLIWRRAEPPDAA